MTEINRKTQRPDGNTPEVKTTRLKLLPGTLVNVKSVCISLALVLLALLFASCPMLAGENFSVPSTRIVIKSCDLSAYIPVPMVNRKPTWEGSTPGMALKAVWSVGDKKLSRDDVFEEGLSYTAIITVTLDPQLFYFDKESLFYYPDDMVEDVDQGALELSSRVVIFVTYKQVAGAEKMPVSDVNLTTKIPAPVVGQPPIPSFTTSQYDAVVDWDGEMPDGKFKSGTQYTATVKLTVEEGFTFANSEGKPVLFTHHSGYLTINDEWNEKELEIKIGFPPTSPDSPVTDLDLTTKIPRPVVWNEPTHREGIISPQYVATSVEWFERRDGLPDTPVSTPFAVTKLYSVIVNLKALEGFTFAKGNDSVSFIHRESARLAKSYGGDGKTINLTIDFPLPATPVPSKFSGIAEANDSVIDLIRSMAGEARLNVQINAGKDEQVNLQDNNSDINGHLELTKDNSPREVTIDGDGLQVIPTGASTGYPLITVGEGVTLTLKNITFKGLENNSAPVIKVASGGKLIMEGGARISHNKNVFPPDDSKGGGVVVASDGELQMNSDANISDTEADYGGGVWTEGIFAMNGGSIHRNRAREGGGVYVHTGYFSISLDGGGTISNNETLNGGGVYVNKGMFVMKGGSISDNTANDVGGGVYIAANGVFTMQDIAKISQNKANSVGGGVFSKGKFTLEYGTISENKAANSGGGVAVDERAIFTMKGGHIRDNTVSSIEGKGGGVGVFVDSDFRMEGGSIISNGINPNEIGGLASDEGKGAGVYVAENATFTKGRNAEIVGVRRSNYDGWEEGAKDQQNYYIEQYSSGNADSYPGSLPGGLGGANRGYAVYWDHHYYLEDEHHSYVPGPRFRNATLGYGVTLSTEDLEHNWEGGP
jgi:hypothetical protein